MTGNRHEADEAVSRPISHLGQEPLPSVLLVRVAADEEADSGVNELALRVLRVRHPLPARERIRVMRPSLIVVGRGVREVDVDLLRDGAREIGAETLELGSFVSRSALEEALRRAIRLALGDARDGAGDLPDPKRASVGR
jgi:hypothetical protein